VTASNERSAEAGILPPFEVRIESTFRAVREGLAAVREALDPLALGTEELGTVELVLAEILNNIVEHAYAPFDDTGTITVRCTHCSDGLHVRIIDRGVAMPDTRNPLDRPLPVAVDFDDLPEGGFGWFLIANLAKDVAYRRCRGENHLTLRIGVGRQT
jgi:serine/threonine-protein kinase RsbW